MDINKCPNCQKQFDQDKRVSKQLPCGCVSCLKCLKNVYQFIKRIECTKHQQVFNISPEELKAYNTQETVLKALPQPDVKFVDQEQIYQQFRCLKDQQAQTQNYYRMIRKVIKANVYFMKHIQSVYVQAILKYLLDQVSMSNVKIENLLQRLSVFQVGNEAQQQQQALILGQQDPHLRSNFQDQQQQQFQSILSEIEELKKEQQMNIQSLRVNVQQCMFNMFNYLSENSGCQLLSDKKAEFLIQKYFKQFKVLRGLSQASNSLVQQNSSFQSQNIDYQIDQESQNIYQQQQQNQLTDKLQGQDIVQVQQFSIPLEISLQDQQIIEAREMFQQLEQKMINLTNDFSFANHVNYLGQEQKILDLVPIPPVDLTLDKLVQFLNKIKNENVSIQSLNNSFLNNLGLIEYPQILHQLPQLHDQYICIKLYEIIQLSKNQPQLQQAYINSLTILNYMNFDFTNIDLSNLDLSTSDLSDTTFTNCNFANSNLTQANLRNTKFINCNLSNCNLTSIITEQPHIFTGHTDSVVSVSISSDNNFIVSGSHDYTIILWNVKTGTSKTMSGHTD